MARAGRKDRGLLSKLDGSGRAVWYVRLWHDGRERRFGSFAAKTKAREFYEKAKLEQKEGRFFPERYQSGGYDLVKDCIDRYRSQTRLKKSQKDQRYFADWWENRFAGQRVNVLTPTVLEDARQDLLRKGFTPQRVNRYVSWLRACLNVAVRDGKLSNNPVQKMKMYKEPTGRTRFLSPEEEALLLGKLGSIHGAWARLAILTGLRQDEQFNLRWADVDLERGLLTLPDTKAGEVQYVALNQEAIDILKGFDSWQRSVWVFPSQNPSTPLNARNFYRRHFLPAVRATKLDHVTWHGLRHTFASRAAMNGASDYDLAACLRHSSTALVKRYAHLSPNHLKHVMEGVARFGKGSIVTTQVASDAGRQMQISSPTVTGTGSGEGSNEQQSHKPAAVLVAVPRIERGTRGL